MADCRCAIDDPCGQCGRWAAVIAVQERRRSNAAGKHRDKRTRRKTKRRIIENARKEWE